MKFIGHILSHLSFIVILGLVTAIIYFRADLFPENMNRPVDHALISLEEKFEIEIPKHEPTGKPFFSQDEPQAESIVYSEVVEQLSPEIVHAEPEIDMPSIEKNEESRDKAKDMQSVVDKIKETVAETVTEMIESVDDANENESQEVVSDESLSLDNMAVLQKARQAYWNGNMAEAEKAYQELSELTSQDPNVYGELGNIYYAQGKWKQAGEAYYEAAVRLIKLNQRAQVNYLLRVIQGLDAESADKLRKKLTG